MSLWDEIKDYADNAPEAGYAKLNYGKVTMKPMVREWKTVDGSRKPHDTPLKEGEQIPQNKSLRLEFEIDIQEFNPQLEFNYARGVDVRLSRGVEQLTDWSEIVLPSLVATFGENWHKKVNGAYVEVEDVPQVNTKKGSEKVYNTIKFLRVFKNKDECLAARNETYKSRGEEGEALAGEVPEEVLGQVRELMRSLSEDDARTVLRTTFPQYETESLIAAAGPF